MHWWPTSIASILVVCAVAVLCFDVDSVDESQKPELANNLNTLMRHRGWADGMRDVKILINSCTAISDPVSAMLEAGVPPIDESTAIDRYKEIWTVLMCKYGEIVRQYKTLVQRFIWVCRHQRAADPSHRGYLPCVRSLLVKLHSASPRFKCMRDALDFVYSLGRQRQRKPSVMVGMRMLAEYTATVGPRTSANMSAHGDDLLVIDQEVKNISAHITQTYEQFMYQFAHRHCFVQKRPAMSAQKFHDDFLYKKSHRLVPEETTLLAHVQNAIDSFVNDIFDSCFYKLGFAYAVGVEGKVIITAN